MNEQPDANGWHKTSQVLPEEGVPVLAWEEKLNQVRQAWYYVEGNGRQWWQIGFTADMRSLTSLSALPYWRPMIALPVAVEKKGRRK